MQLRINLRQFDASFWRYLASFSLFSLAIGYSIYMGCVAMAQPPLYALLMVKAGSIASEEPVAA